MHPPREAGALLFYNLEGCGQNVDALLKALAAGSRTVVDAALFLDPLFLILLLLSIPARHFLGHFFAFFRRKV